MLCIGRRPRGRTGRTHNGEAGASAPAAVYLLTAEENAAASTLRAGRRLAVPTQLTAGKASAYNYYDVGVNIDCRVRRVESNLMLTLTFERSEVPAEEVNTARESGVPPNVQSLRASVIASTPLGTAVNVASLVDPVTGRRYDLLATVTAIR